MIELNTQLKRLAQAKRKAARTSLAAKQAQHEYEEIKHEVLGTLNKAHLDTARSGKTSVSTFSADIVEVEDWDAFYNWIARNKAYDALQRRAAVKALLDRREHTRGHKIPGVKFGRVKRLRVKIDS